MLNKEDSECLRLGRHVLRMIRDLAKVSAGEPGFAVQTLTFPKGRVEMILATEEVGGHIKSYLETVMHVTDAAPPSEVS